MEQNLSEGGAGEADASTVTSFHSGIIGGEAVQQYTIQK